MCLISFNPSLEVNVTWHHHNSPGPIFRIDSNYTWNSQEKWTNLKSISWKIWWGILESNFICIMPDIWVFRKQLYRYAVNGWRHVIMWGKKTKSTQPSFQLNRGASNRQMLCLAHGTRLRNLPEQAFNSFLLHGIEMLTILLVARDPAWYHFFSKNGRWKQPAVFVEQNPKWCCFSKTSHHEICWILPEIWRVNRWKSTCFLNMALPLIPSMSLNDTPLQKKTV